MFLGNRLDHELEKDVAVGRDKGVVVVPVHLELAVGVLMVVLVGAPAETQHGVADFRHDIVTAHQGRLVVTGLGLDIERIGNRRAVRGHDEILRLDAGFHPVALPAGLVEFALEQQPGRIRHGRAVHPAVAGKPADFRLPGKLDQAVGIGLDQHVGLGGGTIEPGCEGGETGAVFLHIADGLGRYEFGAQHAEQVHEADQKIFNFFLFRGLRKIDGHRPSLPCSGLARRSRRRTALCRDTGKIDRSACLLRNISRLRIYPQFKGICKRGTCEIQASSGQKPRQRRAGRRNDRQRLEACPHRAGVDQPVDG